MPVILKLTFPAGRYHATPWGRHVNEGVPKWPPSPWRLLRAIIAVWRRTRPDIPESVVRRILEPLLQPPRFRLPPSRVSHTRHYMPWEKKGPADRTLVFDTFVAVDRLDPLFIGWTGAELADGDRAALAGLLENLASLGRAEAWVHAELSDVPRDDWNCVPAEPSDPDPVAVLCADPASALGVDHYPTIDPKKLRKGLDPDDFLLDGPRWHLCLDTQTIHDRRWPLVPGSLWVNYCRPAKAEVASRSPRRPPPTLARFAIDGPALPRVTETLPLAERVREVLISDCKRLHDPADPPRAVAVLHEVAPSFWGKDAERRPLVGHPHAYFLPVDEDGDGFIDHVFVHARIGFAPLEGLAIDRLRRLRFGDLRLSLSLIGLGECADFARSRLLGPSSTWESATPFVVTRHLKRRGLKRDPAEWFDGIDGRALFVQANLREEWERRAGPGSWTGTETEPLDLDITSPRRPRPIEYHLFRGKPGDDGGRRPRGLFRIRFPNPIFGPICLGHSSHFGLGLFLKPASSL